MSGAYGSEAEEQERALLEWINALEVCPPCQEASELSDGTVLLKALHDLAPDLFPEPDTLATTKQRLLQLLEGLETLLQDRATGGDVCPQLLRKVRENSRVDPVQLAKLALVAAVQNDLPKRRYYVEAIMGLSVSAQTMAQQMIETFLNGGGVGSPENTHSTEEADTCRPKAASLSPSPAAGHGQTKFMPPQRRERLDFSEVRLDAESRFKYLKEEYAMVMDDLDNCYEKIRALHEDLEVERSHRHQAEDRERQARLDTKIAEESTERAREEARVHYEGRLDLEASKAADRLKQKNQEIEALKEEVGLFRSQAADAQRLKHQLDVCRQKIEEHQDLRRENEELRSQVDDLLAKTSLGGGGAGGIGSGGGGEHVQRALARARDDASRAIRARDDLQRQVAQLQAELDKKQELQHGLEKELNDWRNSSSLTAGQDPVPLNSGGRALALEAGSALLAAATSQRQDSPSSYARVPAAPVPPPAAAPAPAPRDDLLEKLLAEKEKRVVDATKIATLEHQLDKLRDQLAAQEAAAAAAAAAAASAKPAAPSQESLEALEEMENQLAQQSHELQVLRSREESHRESLQVQELFMASCFHEVGLRFQKLRLQQSLERNQASGSSSASPKRTSPS